MNILVVSATQFEVKPLLDVLKIETPVLGLNASKAYPVSVLITGIGMVNTAYAIGLHSPANYDLAINAGVCGSFNHSWPLGELVHVTNDTLSELGAEDGDAFLAYNQLNLPGEFSFNPHLTQSYKRIETIKKGIGITVNTIHGNEKNIRAVEQLYHPDVETMEGAAFYATCGRLSKNYTQIRAISNYVEKRDKSKWQMPLAIKNLNDFMIEFINDPH